MNQLNRLLNNRLLLAKTVMQTGGALILLRGLVFWSLPQVITWIGVVMILVAAPIYYLLLDPEYRRRRLWLLLVAIAIMAISFRISTYQDPQKLILEEKAFQRKHNLPDNWLKEK